jgi:hypothetical protein
LHLEGFARKAPARIVEPHGLAHTCGPGRELAIKAQAHLAPCALQLDAGKTLGHAGRDGEGQREIAPDGLAAILEPIDLRGICREVVGLPVILGADELPAHGVEVRRPAHAGGELQPALADMIGAEGEAGDAIAPRHDAPCAGLPDAEPGHGGEHRLDDGLGRLRERDHAIAAVARLGVYAASCAAACKRDALVTDIGGLDQGMDRLQSDSRVPDQVCQGRQTQFDAFTGEAFGLSIQGLVLTIFLKDKHGDQAGPGPSTRDRMERRRRLADLLAGPAGELLAHGLDHLPLTGDHLQGLGDVFAHLHDPV